MGIFSDAFDSAESLAVFLGLYLAISNGVEILAATRLTPWLLQRFGVPTANLVHPALTILVFPLLWWNPVLITAIAARAVRELLENAVAAPIRQLSYNALPFRFRGRVRALLEGVVLFAAMAMAGIVLFAIGDAAGVMPIKVTKNDQLSSFLEPSSAGTAHLSEMSSVSHVEDATVQTLAGVYPGLQQEHGFERPYLKIDTQGFDLKVLRGAGEHLARFPAMQTELSIIPLYERQPSYVEVLELLNREGFAISGMYPVVRDAFFKVIEFDCVLVRDPAAM